MEVQCHISRCTPSSAARVSVWRVGRGRRVPERTTIRCYTKNEAEKAHLGQDRAADRTKMALPKSSKL